MYPVMTLYEALPWHRIAKMILFMKGTTLCSPYSRFHSIYRNRQESETGNPYLPLAWMSSATN